MGCQVLYQLKKIRDIGLKEPERFLNHMFATHLEPVVCQEEKRDQLAKSHES